MKMKETTTDAATAARIAQMRAQREEAIRQHIANERRKVMKAYADEKISYHDMIRLLRMLA